MSLVRRAIARPEQRAFSTVDPLTEALRRSDAARSRQSWTGVPMSPDEILSVPAVWASTMLTAGVISQLPFDEYRKVSEDERQELPTSPLLTAPSADVAWEDWVFQAIESAQAHGMAYGVVVSRDRLMWPTQIEIVHPSRVQARIIDGRIEWSLDRQPIASDDLWRMPGRPAIGSPFGLPLYHYLANVAGTGRAAREYGGNWFIDGGAPSAVIAPESDPGEDGAERLKQKVAEAVRSRRPVVIPQSVKVEPWKGATLQDAQLVELLRGNATDIAMFYCVPPELVGGRTGDSMTYANTEQRVIDLLTFGVAYWLTKLEKALTRTRPRGVYVKANENAIVRTDIRTKTDVLVQQVSASIITPDEARTKLDMPPLQRVAATEELPDA